jgi:hypothetical protein
MEEKKADKQPPVPPEKSTSDRLKDAEKSKQEDKKSSSDLKKAEDFLNRRR